MFWFGCIFGRDPIAKTHLKSRFWLLLKKRVKRYYAIYTIYTMILEIDWLGGG